MYITNLEDDLQKHCTKLYEEKGPKYKKPAAKIGLLKGPPKLILVLFPNCMKNLVVKRVNLSLVSKLYEESGSENKNIEENEKGENNTNPKESIYTNIDECKEKEQAKLLKDEKSKYHHEIARKKGGNEKLWSPRKWTYLIWARAFL